MRISSVGRKDDFKEGKPVAIVKNLCRFGEWRAFLKKYEYPRSTADDLIRRYEDDMKCKPQQLPGNRAIDVSDPKRQVSENYSRFRRRRAQGIGPAGKREAGRKEPE